MDPKYRPAGVSAQRQVQRREPRQTIDSSAVIHLIDLAAVVRGRILDVSLGGCCIRTDQRFPLGIFRRVEAEFRVEGLPFRLGGVTQALYDRCTVGIRFLDVSLESKPQSVGAAADADTMFRIAKVGKGLFKVLDHGSANEPGSGQSFLQHRSQFCLQFAVRGNKIARNGMASLIGCWVCSLCDPRLCCDVSKKFCRVSCHDGVGWHIFGDHAARAHDGILANGDVGKNGRARTD